ncbi:MAG: hypothetical protein QM775_10670 [Pirellulales bacterium]
MRLRPPTNAPTITATAAALAYDEGDGAVAVDAAITLTDPDDTTMTSVVVRITGGYVNGEDVLEFAGLGSISGLWNVTFGRMTLTSSGGATTADFQAALRLVMYRNTSATPTTAPNRTVTFTADDGTTTGSDTRQIAVTAVNNPPTLSTPGVR